ncbi:hypothetical protein ACSBL2_14365 [Pedobacter sp. AW31-3R]|uniref:hypothetical protein n=1 Tax=Pedobacter sp. AW31-3R TaxID=3445781 RepID=UPI003FA0FBBB
MAKKIRKITHAEVRMYKMGTGDCFVIRFFSDTEVTFKMMIDCGTWQGKKEKLIPYIEDLKKHVSGSVDVLVITHEHKDHVYVFEACKELFVDDFTVGQIWMGWTEDEKGKEASQWLKDYGDQKKALAKAANKLEEATERALGDPLALNDQHYKHILGMRSFFRDAINGIADLQFDGERGNYVGMLGGMKVVKELIAKDNIKYFKPGEIFSNIEKATGLKFYILGPPEKWEEVKQESGGKGESYQHNKDFIPTDAFAAAALHMDSTGNKESLLTFDHKYESAAAGMREENHPYNLPGNEWRKIDNDWLNSAGALALRVNSMTNNLSLAFAIEFEDSGRIMLFPGDAEYGSWASWHRIDWGNSSPVKDKPLTQHLLHQTVFYKVAHHLSHNGTAERLGVEMMDHPDLVAMATLDYEVISPNWKNTMPNQPLLKELIKRTKGRLMVMSEQDLLYQRKDGITLTDELSRARKLMTPEELKVFEQNFENKHLYMQYTVKG